VHVAWSQRKVAPSATPPTYACPSSTPADCDARIVVATSTDGGNTFPVAKTVVVDPNVASASNPANPAGRGHQVQASLTFAAGKLLASWLDQRQDHTEGVLQCPTGQTCNSVSDLVEVRRAAKNSNLDTSCHIDVSKPPLSTLPAAQKALLANCSNPAAVWTTYMTDGTPGLVRRHTLDAYTAIADPADAPSFVSSRVSQYKFGNTAQPTPNTYEIVQKEVNAPNLPMFSNGKSAFIGDYIDSAGQLIVATGVPAQPYKFNAGVTTNGAFVTGGFAPAFHIAFTDNRDVIQPSSGDWTTPSCLTSAFTKDPSGNITGVNVGATCGTGLAGNRNQNVYTAAITEHSVAFAGANSKLLANTPRSFVVTVRNLSDTARWYALTIPGQPASGKAAFKVDELTGTTVTPAFVFVQPKSAAARTVFAKSSNGNDKVTVQIASLTGAPVFPLPIGTPPTYTPDNTFTTQVLLNPDANAPLVGNGDGTTPDKDTAIDNLGNVVLSNAVLTNNVLSNNALTNNALSNNALTNAVLSNVVLSNAVLTNLDPKNAVLSNDPLSNNALTNNALSNVVLSNVALSNAALSNVVLSNAVLSNVVLSNNTLNAALTNLDPANVALSNAVLSNNALTNVALSNNALSNVMLTNNALTNAVLSNVVLSNNALSNNALSNNVLSNVALSNAPLGDAANGGDPDALSTIETGSVEIAKNSFQPTDLANSNFKETTFTIRNRGNTDTILAIKLMLRDAVCSGDTHDPNTAFQCTTPPGYKLQLVLRKVALVPVAIPPTGPALDSSNGPRRDIRVGVAQVNSEVSNTSDLPLIDPTDPNFGKFLPDDPKAAMLSLEAGAYAYATIRAIGVGGTTPPDPADLLQWGVKTVASNATTTTAPLIITTQSFPTSFVALTPASPTVNTFGGTPTPLVPAITGTVQCTDKNGNPVLTGSGPPSASLGSPGSWYVDTNANVVYGQKDSVLGWGSGQPQISSAPRLGDPQTGPHAILPFCPLLAQGGSAVALGAFTNTGPQISAANLSFTSQYWGDFYTLVNVADAGSPAETDRQVIKLHVNPRPPVVTFPGFPTQITYQQTLDLLSLVPAPQGTGTAITSTSPVAFTFAASLSATNACFIADGHTVQVDRTTTVAAGNPSICVITISQVGNETYAPITVQSPAITVLQAAQNINFGALITRTYGDAPVTVSATSSSPTAPTASSNPITFTSSTPGVCTTGGLNGATVTILNASPVPPGPGCTINADQAVSANYLAAQEIPQTFAILPKPASVTPDAKSKIYGSPDPTFSGTLIGFVAADNVTAAYSRTPGETVLGSPYTISATLSAAAGRPLSNYLITYNTANFTILPKPASVTPAPASKTYGDSDPPLTGSLSGFLAGDGVTATYSRTPGETVAGSPYTISATLAPVGVLSNYTITYNTANFIINAKPASVTPAAASKVFGDPDPPLTGSLSGFLAGDGVTAVYSRTPGETVAGSPYTISATLSPAGVLGNYAITYNTANFTIEGFIATASMNLARSGHTSTLLLDGTVLVTGGVFDASGMPTTSAEIYCALVAGPLCTLPSDVGTFKATSSMHTPRVVHAATLLADGTVLVAGGGVDGSDTATDSAEVYCAVVAGPLCTSLSDVGTFKVASTMSTARAAHTMTLLQDRSVLIAGASALSGEPSASVDLYCAGIGGVCVTADATFKPAMGMAMPRDSHTATLLTDGTVLVTGGEIDGSGTLTNAAEIYCAGSPAAGSPCSTADGTFKPTVNPMSSVRSVHTASLLQDNRVLVAGGYLDLVNVTASADMYCAVVAGNCAAADLGMFKPVGPLMMGRANQTSTVLSDGWVVAAGGVDSTPAVLASSELFDPLANMFETGAPMVSPRSGHAATRLQNGLVLVTGGRNATGVLNSAELYNVPH
jgi:uncharacterized protein YjbI with pentapeptide repeats